MRKDSDKTWASRSWNRAKIAFLERSSAALAVLGLVLLLWLNQGMPRADWEVLQARVYVSHEASALETAWYPLAFLYRRATDEALYFHTAGAMLGKPVDRKALARGCTSCGGAFALPLPAADGQLHAPYAEVAIEYPPLVLPLILGPRLLTDSLRTYCWIFGALMGSCLLAACTLMMHALRSLGATAKELAPRVLLTAMLALLHGAIAVQRLDAVTALFLALTISAQMRKKRDLAALALGLAAASKFLPLFLLPIICALDRDLLGNIRFGKPGPERVFAVHATGRFTAITLVTFACGIAPFFLFSRTALTDVLRYHGGRGLHVESFAGSLLSTWQTLQHGAFPAQFDYGSFNLAGTAADTIAKYTLLLTVSITFALTGIAYQLQTDSARTPHSNTTPAYYTYLAMLCLFATGKVFSPQYLTWLLPMVFVLPELYSRTNFLLLSALFGISQLYFRGYFDAVYNNEPLGIVTLLVRDLILVGLIIHGAKTFRELSQSSLQEQQRLT